MIDKFIEEKIEEHGSTTLFPFPSNLLAANYNIRKMEFRIAKNFHNID